MLAIDTQRPPKLYLYAARQTLERSLTCGEFRLRPPSGALRAGIGNPYLTLSLARVWNDNLFGRFVGADSCLMIHDTEEFGERIHRAAQKALPSWAGIDAAVSYGAPSPLGAVFSQPAAEALCNEWMFAWRPTQPALSANPVVIQIGSIEGIAEIRGQAAADALLH
jgi:hypothetical protein